MSACALQAALKWRVSSRTFLQQGAFEAVLLRPPLDVLQKITDKPRLGIIIISHLWLHKDTCI
eukprot:11947669-Karenia_brevis.AAC.1